MPTPARVRPAFLRLRRTGNLATSKTRRIYFAPATLVSFELQGFLLPPEIRDSFPSPAPPLLLESSRNRFLSFEGLFPLESGLLIGRHFQTADRIRALLLFPPSEALPSTTGGLGFPSPASFVLLPLPPPRREFSTAGTLESCQQWTGFSTQVRRPVFGTGPSGVSPPRRRTSPKGSEAFRWQT